MKNKITQVIALSMTLFISTNLFAQVVTSSADDGTDGTLRNEIADTPAGGTITFDAAITTVSLNSELLITKELTIDGSSVTIDANFNGRVFYITAGPLELNGLTLTNGVAIDGGAIYLTNAAVTINNCIITNNQANGTSGSGGGIFNDVGGVLTVNDSEISYNLANRAGGGIEDNSGAGLAITLNNVTLNNNTTGVSPAAAAPGNGGGLHITGAGDALISGGMVSENTAAKEGGGLWNGSGIMTVSGTAITGNSAVGDATGGGGIFNNGGTVNINNTTILSENIAMGATPGGRGGAIFNSTDGILNLAEGLAITGNYASRAGGAIEDNSNGTLILSGVTLTGNSAGVAIGLGNTIAPNPGNGGAVHLSGTTNATISNFSTISNNYAAQEGGGLWNNMGVMNVSTTFLDGNIASGDAADDGGGAIFNNGGTLIVGNAASIINNIADGVAGSGGAILSTNGAVTITDAVLAFNQSNRAGGAIEIIDGSIEFSGNFNISDNNTGVSPAVASPGNGGALHISGSATAMIIGGTMANNVAAREGGALWNSTATMTVDGTMIDSNIASGPAADDGGAGIFNNGGTLIVQNGTVITNNVADGTSGSGGGLLSIGGAVMVEDASITNNRANRAGGGIELADGTLDMSSTDLSYNNVGVLPAVASPGNGGGLHLGGPATATIAYSTVRDNFAVEGGGLWNGGSDMTVTTSEISGNSANEGGGVYNETGATSTIMTSTISGNAASISGGGLTNNGFSLELNAVTVAMNETPGNGGGIDAVNSVDLKNTIVALNSAASGTDVSGTIISNDYNLIGSDDLNVFTLQTNDIVGVNPLLGPLQDNGGTTFTHQLLNGSLAYDAGDSTDVFVDQIGQVVYGSARDIGAFEAQMTLSLEDFNSESVFNIFPNPTNGQFNIVIDDSISGDMDVQITSMTGKLLKQLPLSTGNNTMDISGMSSGIYIVNVITNRGRTSHKLILE
ncbi:choice-of-anchor Q domain-containing protein [Winogradskyella rapida]|uniref:Choice-of-anchor Q domain-containing protein n=1 Tax=Winogradskyella rapida TaxID=549701 RepID=A0ABW3KTH0_9FLAO